MKITLRQKLGYCILMKHIHNYKESTNKEDSEMVDISMEIRTENQRRIAKKLLENPEESKPREETYAILHEIEEWIGPLTEQIKKTNCRDINLEEICALTLIIEELEGFDRALGILDRARTD